MEDKPVVEEKSAHQAQPPLCPEVVDTLLWQPSREVHSDKSGCELPAPTLADILLPLPETCMNNSSLNYHTRNLMAMILNVQNIYTRLYIHIKLQGLFFSTRNLNGLS